MGEFVSKEAQLRLAEKYKGRFTNDEINQQLADMGHTVEGVNSGISFENLGKQAANIDDSLKSYVGGIFHAITNPKQTLKGIVNLSEGVQAKVEDFAQQFVPGFKFQVGGGPVKVQDEEGNTKQVDPEQFLDAAIGMAAERFGFIPDGKGGRRFSLEKLRHTAIEDPVGLLADMSSVVSGGGTAIQGAGKLSRLEALANIGKTVRQVGKTLEPISFAGNLVKSKTGRELAASHAVVNQLELNKFFKERAISSGAKAIKLTPSFQEKMVSQLGKNPGQILAEWGVGGSLEDMARQLGEISRKSTAALNSKLAKSSRKIASPNAVRLLNGMRESLRTVKNNKALSVRTQAALMLDKLEGQGMTLSELNEVKRLFDKEFPKAFNVAGEVTQNKRVGDLTNMRLTLQSLIEKEAARDGISNVKDLNKQTQRAFVLKNIIDAKSKVVENRNPFIDRMIVAGGAVGSILSGDPRLIAGAGAFVGGEALITSPKFRSFVAAKMQLLSEGEFKKLQEGIDFARGTVKEPARKIIRKVGRAALEATKATLKSPEARLALRAEEKVTREVNRELAK